MKLSDMIKGQKEFIVGFLGGSITEGAGASVRSNRYASRLVARLQEKHPDTLIREANAGIGGTGSNLGLFRVDRDLLSQKPDIVFIEFSINDWKSYTAKYHEALVHHLRKYRANLPIVFVYTMGRAYFKEYAEGLLPPNAAEEELVAQHYGIPTVAVAAALAKEMGTEERFSEYMTDDVHPGDKGYAVYAEALDKALEEIDFVIKTPSPLHPLVTEAPRMVTVEDGLSFDGWRVSKSTMWNRLPWYLYASKPDTTLHYEFDGKVIGLYHTIEKDSGRFVYSVDGGEWKERTTWDEYAIKFPRANYSILEDELTEGHHTLDLRITETHDPHSEGTFIRIGAMLIG